MSKDTLLGVRYFFRGLGLISRPGVRRYVAIPLTINSLLFASLIAYAWTRLERLREATEQWLPAWLEWLSWSLVPLFIVSAMLVLVYGFSLLANLVAAPFNAWLAEAVEHKLTGQRPASNTVSELLREAVRCVYSELRKLAYFVVRCALLLLLFLIPGVNVVAPFLWLLFSAWMLAIEYLDYPMGNHGISFSDQRQLLSRRRWLGLTFGAAVMIALMVPGLNFVVVPTAVAGATAMWSEQLQKERAVSAG
jgi:CysZ protein